MKDIAPELLEKIQEAFQKGFDNSQIVKRYKILLAEGKATYVDANAYAVEVGSILAKAYKDNISANALPDGRMYFNIAKRVIDPTMENNHDLVADYCEAVQTELNKAAGIGIKAIRPELNQDKIDGIVNRLSEEQTFEKISWILQEPIINFTESVVDDAIETNAEFQYKAGLPAKIVRTVKFDCCDWCKQVAGVYEYPDVPRDVYRRHQHCRCECNFIPSKGKQKQNIWTKKSSNISIKRDERIQKELELENTIGRGKQSAKAYIEKGFEDDSLKDSINREKQARHLENANNGKSYIYGGEKDAEELYNKLKGTGEAVVDRKGKWTNKERVTNDFPVGVDKNTGETKNAMIVYSKTGSHIYPRKEDDK